MSAIRNRDPSGFITQRGRSPFTILRKGSPSSDAPRGKENGKSRGNEICRDEKKKKTSAESSPFLSVSLFRVSSPRKGAVKTRLSSLARSPNKRRKFSTSRLERIVPHRERECKRVAFLQPRVDSGFISEERRPVEESSRGVPGRFFLSLSLSVLASP